jgi:ABC-2 type transport system permease protein
MSRTVHAEWTKLRTTPGTGWLLLAIVALTVAVGAAVSATAFCPADACVPDPARASLTGVQLGQAVVAILAVLAVGGEYGTGMIRVSLTAMPRRTRVLTAKAAVVTGLAVAAAIPAMLGSLLVGRSVLPRHGYPHLSLVDGPVLRAAGGSVLYLALVALLALGTAAAVRDSATAVGVVLALLYVFPLVTQVVSDPHWRRHLQQISPMTAGLAIQATTGLHSLPIRPWAGLGVLAAWAGAALLAGGLVLHLRDA